MSSFADSASRCEMPAEKLTSLRSRNCLWHSTFFGVKQTRNESGNPSGRSREDREVPCAKLLVSNADGNGRVRGLWRPRRRSLRFRRTEKTWQCWKDGCIRLSLQEPQTESPGK